MPSPGGGWGPGPDCFGPRMADADDLCRRPHCGDHCQSRGCDPDPASPRGSRRNPARCTRRHPPRQPGHEATAPRPGWVRPLEEGFGAGGHRHRVVKGFLLSTGAPADTGGTEARRSVVAACAELASDHTQGKTTTATAAIHKPVTQGSSPSDMASCCWIRGVSGSRRARLSPLSLATGTDNKASVARMRTTGPYRRRAAGHSAATTTAMTASGTRTTAACTVSGCVGTPKTVAGIWLPGRPASRRRTVRGCGRTFVLADARAVLVRPRGRRGGVTARPETRMRMQGRGPIKQRGAPGQGFVKLCCAAAGLRGARPGGGRRRTSAAAVAPARSSRRPPRPAPGPGSARAPWTQPRLRAARR